VHFLILFSTIPEHPGVCVWWSLLLLNPTRKHLEAGGVVLLQWRKTRDMSAPSRAAGTMLFMAVRTKGIKVNTCLVDEKVAVKVE